MLSSAGQSSSSPVLIASFAGAQDAPADNGRSLPRWRPAEPAHHRRAPLCELRQFMNARSTTAQRSAHLWRGRGCSSTSFNVTRPFSQRAWKYQGLSEVLGYWGIGVLGYCRSLNKRCFLGGVEIRGGPRCENWCRKEFFYGQDSSTRHHPPEIPGKHRSIARANYRLEAYATLRRLVAAVMVFPQDLELSLDAPKSSVA
jgi:hypothetical protein